MSKKYLIYFILLFVCSFHLAKNIFAMKKKETDATPTLKILDAEYGIFDDEIKSGEYIAIKNSPGIWRDNTYAAAYENYLEYGGDGWYYLRNKVFGEAEVFEIRIQDDIDKETSSGTIIQNGSIIRLKNVSSNFWLGLTEKYHPTGVATWLSAAKKDDKKDESNSWKIEKLDKQKATLSNGDKIYIVSNYANSQGQRLQRFGVAILTDIPVVRPEGGEYPYGGGIRENPIFEIKRLAPEPNRFYPTKFKDKNVGNEKLYNKLNTLIKVPTGLKSVKDGIDWTGNRTKWDEWFGNPTKDSSGMSSLWNQLEIKYQLDRRVYTHRFNQWEESIKLPLEQELIETQNDLKERIRIKQSLESINFSQINGYLKQISFCGKNAAGLNAQGEIFQWNPQTKLWTKIIIQKAKTLDIVKQIGIGSDGTIMAILDKTKIIDAPLIAPLLEKSATGIALNKQLAEANKLYILNKDHWEPFPAAKDLSLSQISIINKDSFWGIKSDGIPVKIQNGKCIPVGKKNFSAISTAEDGTTFALDKDGKIFSWTDGENYQSESGWKAIEGPTLKQIAVGSEKYIWGIDKFSKVYKRTGGVWQEEARANGASQIAINNREEIWLLITESPSAQEGDAVFYFEKNVLSFKDTVSLFNLYSKNYLAHDGTETINLQNAIDQDSTWSIVNAENEAISSPLTYGSNIALQSSYKKYITIDQQNNIVATETTLDKAAKFKIINKNNQGNIADIPRSSQAPILLKATNNKYLAIDKAKKTLIFETKPDLTASWQIK